jgi:uncharacterized protein (TIGR02757 family)
VRNRLLIIKDVLERLYDKYNHHGLIKPDPLQFVYRYSFKADMEIAGFLGACLAYGRVQQIEKSLNSLLGYVGKNPYEYVLGFNEREKSKLSGFKHRFTTGDDISDLFNLLKKILNQNESIESYFAQGYKERDENIIPALTNFCDSLQQMYATEHSGWVSGGLKYLLVNPEGGSACKRLNLFLRWMVRNDDVDAGLWESIDKAKLIVPIDVHMSRLCWILGFHRRKTASLSTAIEVTESFAEIEPDDPVKYDFALSRIGIIENCSGHYGKYCVDCELLSFCCQERSQMDILEHICPS